MKLITDIDTLRQFVKINASTNWDTYRSFVLDAQEKYITPYFGDTLLETIGNKDTDELRNRILRALGPFSLALATDELSINIGEAGHTVTRTTNLAPASDAKIKKATDSLLERGWHNLDRALRFLIEKQADYPTWVESEMHRQVSTALFKNYNHFQEDGMVNINYSPMAFNHLRMLILRIEKSETLILLPADYEYANNGRLMSAMQAYTASRVAELQTNAPIDNNLKDAPPIEFLHEANTAGANYYAVQSAFWKNKIVELLIKDAIIEDSRELKVNAKEKTIFFASGSRIDN